MFSHMCINLDSIEAVVSKAISNCFDSECIDKLNEQVQTLQSKLDSFSDISNNIKPTTSESDRDHDHNSTHES